MCKKLFKLKRCFDVANGGCDQYYAVYVDYEECNRLMGNGLPQCNCPHVWAGFEGLTSTKVNRHTFYWNHAELCPSCEYAAQLTYLRTEREREQQGEYSDHVQRLLKEADRRAELKEGSLLHRCHEGMWAGAFNLINGFRAKADAVWADIETALYTHVGRRNMARPDVQALVNALQMAKNELVGHVRVTTRELATGLVGGKDISDQLDEEAKEDTTLREQQQAAVRQVAAEAERAAREADHAPQ